MRPICAKCGASLDEPVVDARMARRESFWPWAKRRIWIPQAITIVMLLIALNPSNPYGYYILLRWVCCAAYAYLLFQAIDQDKQPLAWVLGVTAIVYNPILYRSS
ncbi:MAG: DUF6804 family protein [Candidatus Latescibacterota bacterium]